MAPEILNHLQRECPKWDRGDGTILESQHLLLAAESFHIRHKISTDPLWRIVDSRKVWYCPHCALPTRGRFSSSGAADSQTIHLIRGHLAQCTLCQEGVLQPPLHLQVSYHICNEPTWRHFTRDRDWVCPFCAQKTGVLIDPDLNITTAMVEKAAKHLGRCFAYKRPGAIHCSREELETTVRAENQLVTWKPKIAKLLQNDPVWSVTIDDAIWVCPFCRNRINHIRLTSPLVRQETCPQQITTHLINQCPAFRQQKSPATTEDELRHSISSQHLSQKTTAPLQNSEEFKEAQSSTLLTTISQEIESLKTLVTNQEGIEKSLEEARKKQLQMLPDLPQIEGYQFLAIYRPCDKVGGDFYDFLEVGEQKIGILIGDVSGHGMDAALVMGMTKKLLNIYARRRSNPAEVLSIANEDIQNDLDQATFVTTFYSILDTKNRSLSMARAGHNPLILFNPKRNPTIQTLQPPGMALGMTGTAKFDQTLEHMTLDLQSGDCLVQFTDGLTEAMNHRQEEFGLPRLLEVIQRSGTQEPEYLAFQIDRALERFGALESSDDDITILICQVQ